MGGKTGLQATVGSYFVILSDEARPVYYISRFPEEMEYLHTLDVRLEVCSVLPTSILQMMALNINIVTLKVAGKPLPLELQFAALAGLGFIYDSLLTNHVPPFVKRHPLALKSGCIQPKITKFVQQDGAHMLLIAAGSGMGKMTCALWLSRQTQYLDRRGCLCHCPLPSGRSRKRVWNIIWRRHSGSQSRACSSFGLIRWRLF